MIPTGKAARFTGGKIVDVDPSEKQGYIQYGRMLGGRDAVAKERRTTHRKLAALKQKNKQFISALRRRGGEQLDRREQMIKDQDIRGGQVVQQMHGMQKEGELLESRIRAGGRQLSQRDATIRGKQTRIDQLVQEGRGLEGEHKARMRAGGRQLSQRDATIRGKEQRIGQLLQEGRSLDKEFVDLRTEANRRIQNLEKRLNDGTGPRGGSEGN
jgi:hypothetical protein